MAGGIATALAGASRRGGRRLTGDFGLFEVDEFWLGQVVEELAAAGDAARQPVPRPARPLRRAGDDRRPLGGDRGQRTARTQLVLNADDPLVADLGRTHEPGSSGGAPARARRIRDPSEGVVYFGVDDDSLALPELQHAARLQALPPLRPRLHLRAPSTSPTSATTTARTAARAPDADGGRHRRRAARHPQRRLHAAAAARVELPLPGLYNVYNALGAAALTLCARRRARRRRRRPGGRRARVRPRRDARSRRPRRPRCCWSRTPRARTRCCARSRWRSSELDLFGVLNDRIADGRDVSWVWDADWELLVGRVRRFTCSGTRAAELALRMKYAGLDTDAHPRRRRPRAGPRRGARHGDGPLYVIPTYTALLELRELLTEPRPGGGVLAMSFRGRGLARRRVRPLRRRPAALAASSPPRPSTASWTSAPAPAASRSSSPQAGHDVTALDLDPELLAVLDERARAAGVEVDHDRRRRRRLHAPPPRRPGRRADADDPAAARARRLLRLRPPLARAPAAASRWRSRPSSSPTTGRPRSPRPTSARPTAGRYISQPIAIRVDDDHVADRAHPPARRPRRRARRPPTT